MCLLVSKPAGVEIDDIGSLCEKATRSNADGFGCAVRTANGIKIFKGMLPIENQVAIISEVGDSEAMFHWRWGTSGSKDKFNCHPFKIKDGTVFGHNGVMQVPLINGMSDTHSIAHIAQDKDDLVARLSKNLSGNKFVVMPTDADTIIINEKVGTWKGGVWYSNMSWNYTATATYSPGGKTIYSNDYEWWNKEGSEFQKLDKIFENLVRKHGYPKTRCLLDRQRLFMTETAHQIKELDKEFAKLLQEYGSKECDEILDRNKYVGGYGTRAWQ